jgi:hypothetical protein
MRLGRRHGVPVSRGRLFVLPAQGPFQTLPHIEKINWPFLSELNGSPAEYGAGLKFAIDRGWLWMHESGTYVKLTESGAAPFA